MPSLVKQLTQLLYGRRVESDGGRNEGEVNTRLRRTSSHRFKVIEEFTVVVVNM
jgi:hypothetical protein